MATEHACSLHNADEYQQGTFVSMERDHNGKKYRVNMAQKKGETVLSDQSYRYPTETWTASAARSHCTAHNGIDFVPASQRGNTAAPTLNQAAMPMPTPGESQTTFLRRCMDEMSQDVPDPAERQAACQMQWEEEGQTENRASWYQIRNAQSDTAEILVYDEIGGSWLGGGIEAKKFVEDLRAITAKTINVRINSPGGSVFDGFAIYNALRRAPARIVVDIDGMALSIASVIALSGHEIRMAKNALYMIHDPAGMVMGTAEDMRSMADTLEKVKQNIAGVYQDKTLKPLTQLEQLMSAETWYTASEAKDAGFIDTITDERQVSAFFDLTRYKHPPHGTVGNVSQPLTPSAARPAPDARRAKLAQMAQHARRRI